MPTTGLEALVMCVSSTMNCWKMDSALLPDMARLRGNDMEIRKNDMEICGN
jgi:hypothetical protein